MRTNQTKAKLKAGEAVFGCFLRTTDPTTVDFLGYQPWDFMVFDGEHGTLEPRDCENLVRAAELHDITPLVRVTTNLPPIILRFLDTGAQGLLVPWVNSASEAQQAVPGRQVSSYGQARTCRCGGLPILPSAPAWENTSKKPIGKHWSWFRWRPQKRLSSYPRLSRWRG